MENNFLHLLINISEFPSLSVCLCPSLYTSSFSVCVCDSPSRLTHALSHTAWGYIQTTMAEWTRGDGLLTDRVQAVCVTLGGYPLISATALGNLLLLMVCLFLCLCELGFVCLLFLPWTDGIPRSPREKLEACQTGKDKLDQQPTTRVNVFYGDEKPKGPHCLVCITVDS